MSDSAYRRDLAAAVEELWRGVTELVLITLEDQPGDPAPAAVDAFAEQVSELQGEVAAVRTVAAGPAGPATWSSLDAVTWRYWQRIRSFDAVACLRTATRRRGGGWPAWQRSVEQSARSCENALLRSRAAATPDLDTVPAGPITDDPPRRML
jgi:hypothetical protein